MEHIQLTPSSTYLLRLAIGEPVHETIAAFCVANKITSAWFTALGAVHDIHLGYYSMETRAYHFEHYADDHEVVTMVGNVTLVDGAPFLHIHTTISDATNRTYGGHLRSAIVAVTLEVHITAYAESIHRVFDERTGLKLCAL
jgi:uncharacterized protein